MAMLKVFRIFSPFIALLAARTAADAISVSEALAVTETGARYEIAGEVVSTTRYWSALRDDSGIIQVRNWTKPWDIGDVVSIEVEMVAPSPTDPNYVRQIARRSSVTGHRPPPPPVEAFAGDVLHGRIGAFHPVVLRGTVSGVIPDDIDASWSYIIVESGGEQAIVSLGWRDSSVRTDLPQLIEGWGTVPWGEGQSTSDRELSLSDRGQSRGVEMRRACEGTGELPLK